MSTLNSLIQLLEWMKWKDLLKQLIDFKPLTEYTITSPQKYLKELKRVKNIGYAVDFQEDSIYQIN